MENNNPATSLKDSREKRLTPLFWMEFFAGIGATLYLVLMLYAFFNSVSNKSGTAIVFSYYEIVLVAYFLLLMGMIGKGGENFRFLYSVLALADALSILLVFGFDAINYYPGSSVNPLQWNISNVGTILSVYPINILLVLMFAGTGGVMYIRLRPVKFQEGGT